MDFLKSGSGSASTDMGSSVTVNSRFNPAKTGPLFADVTAKKQAIKDQVKTEIAMANAQELVNKINEKCFEKCVTKPSTSLGSSEETCLTRCMDRYMEAFNIVSKSYVDRLSKERGAAAARNSGTF